MATCIAGDPQKAKKAIETDIENSPWTVLDLCKIRVRKEQEEDRKRGVKYSVNKFEQTWMILYGYYKWLCKIKHPTVASAFHDALAITVRDKEFLVMATPDMRKEDLPNKCTILLTTLDNVKAAIYMCSLSFELDSADERVISWTKRFNSIQSDNVKAFEELIKEGDRVTITTGNTKLAKKWRKLTNSEADSPNNNPKNH